MTSSPGWGVARRVGFRFGFVFGILLVFPFPISAIPKMTWLTEILRKPRQWGVSWFAQSVLGLADPPTVFTGSGDGTESYVQLLLFALIAAIGTIVWSALDRRRTAYPRLAAIAWVVLRYYVAWAMLSYGFGKILKSQFPDLRPRTLHQRLGDTSPMGLLWIFMGYSTPYTVFAGLAEALGGVLLLSRRTATLGALVVIAVMTNVVMLNFSYDVPVKLYSMCLLIMAGFVALPGARRLIAAVLGYAVAELPPRVRMSRRRERVLLIAKLLMLATLAAYVYDALSSKSGRNDHVHPLYGTWTVDNFFADGVELAPRVGDPMRWQTWTANAQSMSIWLMDGRREGETAEKLGAYLLEVDTTSRTMTLTIDEEHKTRETWSYTEPAPDRLIIDCMHGGKYLHVTLHRAPEGLLMTRGFRWINEVPFNR